MRRLDEIAELAGAERGRLRIGSASAMVTTDVLPKLLKEVRKQHAGRGDYGCFRNQRGFGSADSRR